MDNGSKEAMVLNNTVTHNAPVYLKQSVPMMVVYTLAYSAVFFLGISLFNIYFFLRYIQRIISSLSNIFVSLKSILS